MFTITLPSSPKDFKSQRWHVTSRKQHFPNRIWLTRMWLTETESTHETYARSIPAQRRGGPKVPPLVEKLFAIGDCQRGGNACFSVDTCLSAALQCRARAQEYVLNTNLTTYFCVPSKMFLKREKEHEVGWVRRWRRTWEDLGEEGTYDQNTLLTFLRNQIKTQKLKSTHIME